ncbi:MAG: hypothetical protein OJF60_002115 [Burkholderiaceae bacterium]|nr:MAG: hypothetical protein OJF60_002115 [Burkholderiaceae bacterium]
MDCDEARDLLDAYADNALGLGEAARLNHHLQDCATCRAELDAIRDLGHALRAQAPYHRAPDALRRRVLAGLPQGAAAASPRPAQPGGRTVGRGVRAWASPANVANLAMGMIAACALVLAAVLWLQRPTAQGLLAQQIVASHVRALLSGHPIDVISTDEHTVKPWFNGRLDYAPPVVDLASLGFPLVGGRVDYVGARRVAVLTYHAGGHPIDLYLFPTTGGTAAPQTRSNDGYSLATWTAGGMRYWAITDAQAAVLQRFVQDLRSASS